MLSTNFGEVCELRAAGVAVGEDGGVGVSGPDGREQLLFGDCHGHVVVALFDAEVAGKTAATAETLHARTRLLEQLCVRTPPHHRVMVAVWLRNNCGALQGWWFPSAFGEQFGEGVGVLGDRCRGRGAEEFDGVGAQDSGARRFHSHNRDTGLGML